MEKRTFAYGIVRPQTVVQTSSVSRGSGWGAYNMGRVICWEAPDGVLKRYFGHVTDSEVLEGNQQVEADPRFDELRYVVNDFTDCTSLETSSPDVEAIAAIDGAAAVSNSRIRIAIVATHVDVLAVSRAYASSSRNPYDTRIFESVDEARAWLAQ